ncbi:MAG: hypothetical protein RR135_00315 [Oscillospiraceae bacterium]
MKQQWGFGVGSASILTIFVLLCLTTFATLSLASAEADARLARRAARSVSDYYAADSNAVECVACIEATLYDLTAPDASSYYALAIQRLAPVVKALGATVDVPAEGAPQIRLQCPIDEGRALSVLLKVTSPPSIHTPRVSVVEWKTIQTLQWQEDDRLNLWSGSTLTTRPKLED